ncbi:MAG: WD40 repeat domain-containing protein, partial [Ardenticatenaceae bacterium]
LERGELISAFFTPDRRAIAVAWANGISLLDVETAEEQWWQPTDVPIVAAAGHPQREAIAAALVDGSIIVFDAVTGLSTRFEGAEPNIHHGDIAWSPDGMRIAFQFVGPNRQDPIYLLDVVDGSLHTVPESQIGKGKIPGLVWSPDSMAVTLTDFGEACTPVLDLETGAPRFRLQYRDECHFPYAMIWASDGSLFGLAGAEGVVLVDPRLDEIVRTLTGQVLGYTVSRGAFSTTGAPLLLRADGRFLASKGGIDLTGEMFPLIVWDMQTGEQVAQLGEQGNAYDLGLERRNRLTIAFDGDSLLSLYENGEITRWAFAAERAKEVIVSRIPVIAPQGPLVWSADSRRMAAANRYGGVVVWDIATGERIAQFNAPLGAPALSPSGDQIALIDPEAHELVIYDLSLGQLVLTLPDATFMLPHASPLPFGTAFSPNGREIAYPSANRVIVADIDTGDRISVLTGYPIDQLITRVVWAPDGDALVVTSGEPLNSAAPAPLILWERTENRSFTETFRAETINASNTPVTVALFSPSGNRVALEQKASSEVATQLLIYDRAARDNILTLQDSALAAWISEEVLLTTNVGQGSQLTRWHVRTSEQEVTNHSVNGGEVYAPSGLYYARPHGPGRVPEVNPDINRAVDIYDWVVDDIIASGYHGSDLLGISWSPDGHWITSLATDSTIKVWPVQ